MRKWIDIVSEAPVGNIDSIDMTSDGSFRDTDRKIIQSPKAQAKIRRVLAKVPQTIDLVFFDSGAPVTNVIAHGDQIGGVFHRPGLAARWPHLPEPSSPDAITVILTHNEGANRVQLSPWIIMHRMAHAVTFSPDSDYKNIIEGMAYDLDEMVDVIRGGWGLSRLAITYYLGTMKSAREQNLNASEEIIMEWFAQYCVQGRITLNRMTEEWLRANSHEPVREGDAAYINEVAIQPNEGQLNRRCEDLLKKLEGKVVIL